MSSVYFDPAVGGDGSTVTDDSNSSTGLAGGGHRLRFVPALAQVVTLSGRAVHEAQSASDSASAAGQSVVAATGLVDQASGLAAEAGTQASSAALSADRSAEKSIAAAVSAQAAKDAAVLASAVSGIPSILGKALSVLRVNAAETGLEWGVPISTTITGNLAPYVTQTTALTITNLDSATTYAVSATGGTATIANGVITYTAGLVAGDYGINISAGGAKRSVPITVIPSSVVAPVITSPVSGATITTFTPVITTGSFASIGLADTHSKTDWELRTAASGSGTLVASSLADTSNKTSWMVPGSVLVVSTMYYVRARHHGTALGAGDWGEASFMTAAALAPTVPGTAYQGGFYMGKIVISGVTYALVVAPRALGQSNSLTLKTTDDTTAGTLSLNDGLANSNAMNNAAHPAAQFCRGLSVGGYTDWYLPSRDELEICYRNAKSTNGANKVYASRIISISNEVNPPGSSGLDAQGNGDNDNSSPAGGAYTTINPAQTTVAAFIAPGGVECFDGYSYRSSTESSAKLITTMENIYICGWIQESHDGKQSLAIKTDPGYVRAIRKVPI